MVCFAGAAEMLAFAARRPAPASSLRIRISTEVGIFDGDKA